MAHPYKGHYSFDDGTIRNWESDSIGVYYCGIILPTGLKPLYIGRAIADDGIRGRLLQHHGENKWYDVTHFGYVVCVSAQEAINLEASEIAAHKPKYNVQGK